jgi:hypothetical protein
VKNIVINWINNSSVKNLGSLKDIKAIYLFYNDSDLLPFTIMQALMGYEVKYISYQGGKDNFWRIAFLIFSADLRNRTSYLSLMN